MKYNADMAIRSLAKLISETNIVNIDIGDYEKTGDKYDLIIVGNDIYSDSIGKKLKRVDANIKIKRQGYIVNKTGVSIEELLKRNGCREDIAKNVTQIVDKINNDRAVAVQFRGKLEIEILGAEHKVGRSRFTRVAINNDTGDIEERLVISELKSNKIIAEITITEYNKEFTVNSSVIKNLISKHSWGNNVIKIQNSGFIETVELINNYGSIIVDNSYVVFNGEVAGYWEDNIVKYITENEHVKDAMKSVERALAMHRRYIIPFGFCETNKVKMEE